jgi:hypothetical protein
MNPTDDQAERLVAALDRLLDGESAVAALVALGSRAIGPLRRFLLEGRPSTVYQPRRWAVQALGGLDAKEVLIEYLTSLPPIADPQIRLAEEAVENAALREFVRWPGAETTAFLLALSKDRMRAGLVEAFGKLGVVEAIPYLDRALEDDYTRLAAEQALKSIGEPAREALLLSATIALPRGAPETPSSLRRRQSVLRVLAELGIRPDDWPRLRELVWEPDPEIAIRTCALAVQAGLREDREAVIGRLVAVAGQAPWFLQEDIVACLLSWFDAARPLIEAEIARRARAPEIEQAQDQCLRLLRRVMRRGLEARGV